MIVQIKRRTGELALVLVLSSLVTLAFLISNYYLRNPLWMVGLFGGFIFVFVTMRWPEIGILALVAVTGGLIDTEWLPFFDLGPVSFHVSDLMLFVLLGLVFMRATAKTGFHIYSSPLTAPLVIFICAILFSIVNAIFIYDVDVNDVLRMARILIYWLVFFPTLQLVRDERSIRRLITGLWFLSATLVVGVILPETFSFLHLLPSSVVPLTTAGREIAGTTRIFSVSERLLYVLIPVTLGTMATTEKGRQFWRVGLLAGLLFWLYRSFQRNYWLTTFMNCSLLILLLSGQERLRLIKRLVPLMMIGLVFLIALQIAQPGLIMRQIQISTDRMYSILDNPTSADPNIRYRLFENRYLLRQISRHPILGIGLANAYRPLMIDEFGDFILNWYSHNAYLWIAVMMGLVGLLPFLWLLIAYLFRTLRWWRKIPDSELRGVYLGFGMAFLGMMVSNIVAPNFIQTWSLTIYPVMMGISEGILRNSRKSETDIKFSLIKSLKKIIKLLERPTMIEA